MRMSGSRGRTVLPDGVRNWQGGAIFGADRKTRSYREKLERDEFL